MNGNNDLFAKVAKKASLSLAVLQVMFQLAEVVTQSLHSVANNSLISMNSAPATGLPGLFTH